MPLATSHTMLPHARVRGTSPLDLIATGWALTSALVGLFVLCYVASFVWPMAGLAHGWIRLFATEPDNVVRTLIEGIVGSVVAAWIAALLFVPVYNRVAGR
jgi:hypothetical protein